MPNNTRSATTAAIRVLCGGPGGARCSSSLLFLFLMGMAAGSANIAAADTTTAKAANTGSARDTVVAWAMEDAALDRQAGRNEDAIATEAEAKALAAGPELQPISKLPANLFPAIPHLATNPYARDLFAKAVDHLNMDERFPKGEIKIRTAERGWNYIVLSSEAHDLLLAYFHPQSKFRGDNRLLLRSLRILENGFDGWLTSDKTLADFGTFDVYTHDYLLLKAAMPDAILPSKKERWEKAIALNAEKVASKEADSWNQPGPHRTYLNSDVRYMNGLAYAGAVLGRNDLTDLAAKGLIWNAGALLPDGAFDYLGNQTECFTYHEVDLFSFADYYLFTGDEQALDIIRKTKHYYPLSLDPRGVAEYFTAPSWKYAWNMNTNADSAALVANLTGDGQNARIGTDAQPNFLLACFYRSNVAPAPAPDNYLLYDSNIEGPRGRFGDFSFAGVLRDPSSLPPGRWELGMGRGSIVGAMQLDPTGASGKMRAWPVNAVINGVSIGLRVKPDGPRPTMGDMRSSQRYMMQDIQGDAIVRPTASSVAATYHLTNKTETGNKSFEALPWLAHQMWLLLPDRVIGWVELQPESAQSAMAVLGRIELLSGRASWGVKKNLQSMGTGRFGFGDLRLHITDQNLGDAIPQPTAGIYAGANTSGDDKFVILNLASPQFSSATASASETKTFDPAHPFYFVVEIRSAAALHEAAVERKKLPSGLWRLAVREESRDLWLYFNPDSTTLNANDSLPTKWKRASVQQSCSEGAALPVDGGTIQASFSVPAHGSRLVIASDLPQDHAPRAATYDEVFKN